MGVPNPKFTPDHRLTEAEAAILAQAALGRARAALVQSRLTAAPARVRAEPAAALAPFAEGAIILGSALACLLAWAMGHG